MGYHLSEYIAVQALYMKDFTSPSSALSTLQKQLTDQNNGNSTGATTSTNPPRYYAGGEVVGSVLYGKLSVLGQAIIYYDFNVMAGLGMTDTDNGNYATEHVGVGQQVYLSKHLSVKVRLPPHALQRNDLRYGPSRSAPPATMPTSVTAATGRTCLRSA